MRPVVALTIACLLVGGGSCSKRPSPDGTKSPANVVGSATASANAPRERIASASYGESFPRFDAVPAGLYGKFEPTELRLVVQPQASALPLAKRLAIEQPGLIVVVYDDSPDERTAAWLAENGLLRFEDQGDLRETLRELTSDPKLGNYLSKVTTPWPSMAIADGVAREFHEASLFHGPWLVWAGSTADARYPVTQAARGSWSRKALDDYESIRDQIQAQARALLSKRVDVAKQLTKAILERPDAQPGRLIDMAQGLSFTLQDREDLTLAYRLADRAVNDTFGLEHTVLREAAFVHHLTGDPEGALKLMNRALPLCKEVQVDCSQIEGNRADWQRCPWRLVELEQPLDMGWMMRFRLELRPGTPANCKPGSGMP